MERLDLEFRSESISRDDIELLDSFFEHKRWLSQKTKALFRDWQRDKCDLKEKTVRMIEQEVEETKLKLLKELELFKTENMKEQKYRVLEEKRKEYEAKMLVIRELEEEKRR